MYELDNGPIECLAALSRVLDMANGLGEDKSVLCALFARALAGDAGLSTSEQAAAFQAALLRHLGCTAFAPTEQLLAQDDVRLRRALLHAPSYRAGAPLVALAEANASWLARAGAWLELAADGRQLRARWLSSACDAARLLAADLGCGEPVLGALDEVFEQWDGRGGPAGRAGDAISRPARVAGVAHETLLHWLDGGSAQARERLAAESGRRLDPALAERAARLVTRLDTPDFLALGLRDAAADPLLRLDVPVDRIAAAFGDFADLQSPFLHGHARAVRTLAERMAHSLGLPAPVRGALLLAASLHDIGQVSVPTSLWLQPRPWRPAERERANTHVYVTARSLALARPLANAGRVAAGHHERLDGRGYPTGLAGAGLSAAARLLAVVEQAVGLCEPRPHRPAHSATEAAALLGRQAAGGALDVETVDAAIALITDRPGAATGRGGRPVPELLTERESEVLARLAAGLSNKQIARELGISDRTVQSHAAHVYAKLGVRTRAGATLVAAQRGWVSVAEPGG